VVFGRIARAENCHKEAAQEGKRESGGIVLADTGYENHCLFSGIIDEKKQKAESERLIGKRFFRKRKR
jgi:hypothetical protein